MARTRARQAGDEGAVDLDGVDGQGAQQPERGVAGAEVVDGDAHTQRLQALELAQRLLSVVHRGALGELELLGGRPVAATASAKSARQNWMAETLTATRVRQEAACQQACCSTQVPVGTIKPLSSARGMKRAGGTRPCLGCRQRSRASTPMTRRSSRENCGW